MSVVNFLFPARVPQPTLSSPESNIVDSPLWPRRIHTKVPFVPTYTRSPIAYRTRPPASPALFSSLPSSCRFIRHSHWLGCIGGAVEATRPRLRAPADWPALSDRRRGRGNWHSRVVLPQTESDIICTVGKGGFVRPQRWPPPATTRFNPPPFTAGASVSRVRLALYPPTTGRIRIGEGSLR